MEYLILSSSATFSAAKALDIQLDFSSKLTVPSPISNQCQSDCEITQITQLKISYVSFIAEHSIRLVSATIIQRRPQYAFSWSTMFVVSNVEVKQCFRFPLPTIFGWSNRSLVYLFCFACFSYSVAECNLLYNLLHFKYSRWTVRLSFRCGALRRVATHSNDILWTHPHYWLIWRFHRWLCAYKGE